ncbi:H-type small acid-soluble spore protein [Virgibacillus byunsanensis]|uniref:Small, acid-soluble spore protein H n=1 Tax=Virgibacillus byunsanensis TaxID=570945 RepID=A0ABW3LP87_9BACI
MDSQRAQQIIESPTMINVNYNGIPVYIQEVHSSDKTATIFPLDEMDHEQKVELDGLVEQESH